MLSSADGKSSAKSTRRTEVRRSFPRDSRAIWVTWLNRKSTYAAMGAAAIFVVVDNLQGFMLSAMCTSCAPTVLPPG